MEHQVAAEPLDGHTRRNKWISLIATVFSLASLPLLAACALGVQNSRYAGATSPLTDTESGIVLGTITGAPGVTFIKLDSSEEIDYYAAGVYCMRLPVGAYALKSIGTPSGSVSSAEPFSFTVEAGQRAYLGAVVDHWSVNEEIYEEDRAKPHAKRYYGSAFIAGRGYEYVVFDRFSTLKDGFNRDCPTIHRNHFRVSLMR